MSAMNTDELMGRLVETEQRCKSNTHRLDELTERVDVLNRLTTAVEVMAAEQKHQGETMAEIKTDVTALDKKVDIMEKKPGKRWEDVVKTVITVAVTAVVILFLNKTL